jgi:MarR family transcriptional regulator for hemolysin
MGLSMANFGFVITDIARLIRRNANRRIAALGATEAQWRILAWLQRLGDGLRQNELAEALEIDPATPRKMIDRLEAAGPVERRHDEWDRRVWRIHLTKPAVRVLARLEVMGSVFDANVLSGTPDQIAKLRFVC